MKDELCESNLVRKLKGVQARLILLKNECSEEQMNNLSRRRLYSEVELLRIETTDIKESSLNETNIENDDSLSSLYYEIDKLSSSLDLRFVKRDCHWYDIIDEVIRCIGVWLCLITFATTLALPMIIYRNIDILLVRKGIISPYYQITAMTRMFIGKLVLILSGIALSTEGLDINQF